MQPSTVDSRLQDKLYCYPVATISGFSLSQIGDSENFLKTTQKQLIRACKISCAAIPIITIAVKKFETVFVNPFCKVCRSEIL